MGGGAGVSFFLRGALVLKRLAKLFHRRAIQFLTSEPGGEGPAACAEDAAACLAAYPVAVAYHTALASAGASAH